MSDFIYSKQGIKKGKLTKEIQAIYHRDEPPVEEFHGEWGSLAVSRNLYKGFAPYETTEYVCVVIGGPVLCFRDNAFLKQDHGYAGTKAIYERWREGIMQWDRDLSGPFAILIINKTQFEVTCITDLMAIIPVFTYQDSTDIMLSTHVDVLANVSGQQTNVDIVSKVDFILHGVVTFPYTSFTNIRQLTPAAAYFSGYDSFDFTSYWVPVEKSKYTSIEEAAKDLSEGLQKYVKAITSEVFDIAQFISGGEDSRVLLGLLSKDCDPDSYIFLDHMNREGKVAEKAAAAYGVNFNVATRSKIHYLKILPPCTDMVGDGSQYFHAHTYGFHNSCGLNKYAAVFGGLFSDALLKGARIKKVRGSGRLPFLPDIKRRNYTPNKLVINNAFSSGVLQELTKRRQAHLKYIKRFRNESAEEWFELWPSSMNMNIPNFHANRRLFRSYEPFMTKDVIKISAAVPQKWKLNRKLFHKTAKPLLKPTKWLLHSDGWFPYFPVHGKVFVHSLSWVYREIGVRTGVIKGNQGPWAEWDAVMNSPEWKRAIDEYSGEVKEILPVIKGNDIKQLFESHALDYIQRINLLQVLYGEYRKKT